MDEQGTAASRGWVTFALLGANVLMYFVLVAAGAGWTGANEHVYVRWGANVAQLTAAGEWWRLATSMFLHFGFMHLLFNMQALLAVGYAAERLYGSGVFALLYFYSGLMGSFLSLLQHQDRIVISAGASGAIFGVFGAFLAYVVAQRKSLPPGAYSWQRTLVSTALVFVFSSRAGSDIAAHTGGLIAGFVLGLLMARRRTWILGGVFAAASLVALYALAPPPRFSYPTEQAFSREFVRFAREEDTAIDRYNSLIDQGNSGKITDAQFAALLKKDCLPVWENMELRLKQLKLQNASPSWRRYQALTGLVHARCVHLRALIVLQDTGTPRQAQVVKAAHQSVEQAVEALKRELR